MGYDHQHDHHRITHGGTRRIFSSFLRPFLFSRAFDVVGMSNFLFEMHTTTKQPHAQDQHVRRCCNDAEREQEMQMPNSKELPCRCAEHHLALARGLSNTTRVFHLSDNISSLVRCLRSSSQRGSTSRNHLSKNITFRPSAREVITVSDKLRSTARRRVERKRIHTFCYGIIDNHYTNERPA